MRYSLLLWLIYGILLLLPITVRAEDTQARFERVAAHLPLFPTSDFLYNRADLLVAAVPRELAEPYHLLLPQLVVPEGKTAELEKLLKHPDPKVRTLALAALFIRNDPKLLPQIAALVSDDAETFPDEAMLDQGVFSHISLEHYLVKQTVGQVAEKMVDFYLVNAGYYSGVKRDFPTYWARHKDHVTCLSWFRVQLERANGISPDPKDRLDPIHAVRAQIDRLQPVDRALTLITLAPERGALVSEADLVAAARYLGQGRLRQILQGQMPSDDPDLQTFSNGGMLHTPGNSVITFLLHHATQLLKPTDADIVLAIDPSLEPARTIAASELQPEHADTWLHAAILSSNGEYDGDKRAAFAAALWRLIGPAETPYLVDWFYTENPQRGQIPHCRAEFLNGGFVIAAQDAVGVSRAPENRDMIARIIQDQRFDGLDWQSLETLVTVINRWTLKPVVTEEALRAAWHPYGEGSFDWQRDQAAKAYPKETQALLDTLQDWRDRLRASVSLWNRSYSNVSVKT